jgi:predicted Zn-dependent peptidase
MNKKEYQAFDEELYTTTLSNGLKVNILPKAGFQKTYAVLTSNFGSMDREFMLNGERIQIPAGTAHFLEHKLFEKADYDAFELFTNNGADSNAFTSYSKTSYLFSSTDGLKENLDILLDFVQNPYFSTASVAKEQGIIGQEIQMYNDDVDWQLYMGILKNLFVNQPISDDIAGTVESIAQITPELLYKVHQVFYRPQNMHLFVTGNLDVEEVLSWIEANQAQKEFDQELDFEVEKSTAKAPVVIEEAKIALEVKRPKVMLGINNATKLPAPGLERLEYIVMLDLAFYLMLSSSSKMYLKLYDAGLLDDTFGYDLNSEREELFLTMGGDATHPVELIEALKSILKQGLTMSDELQADFELAKKEMFGRSITRMNSLEAIANSFEGEAYGNTTIFDEANLYASITLADVIAVFDAFMQNVTISTFEIESK